MTQRWHIPRQPAATFSPLRVPRDPCDELIAWITISRHLEICGSTFVQRFLWRECHGDVEWNASAFERIGDDVPAIAKARGALRGRVTEDKCKATLEFRKHILRRMGHAYVAQRLFWDPSTFIRAHLHHPSWRHKVCFHPSTTPPRPHGLYACSHPSTHWSSKLKSTQTSQIYVHKVCGPFEVAPKWQGS